MEHTLSTSIGESLGVMKGRISDVKERVSEMKDNVRDTAAGIGRSAADSIDRNLHSAAGALEKTSSALRSKAGSVKSERITDMAQTAADKLDNTARYLRDHDTRVMVGSAGQAIRRNPGIAMAAALGVGVLIGMSLGRNRRRY